MATLDTYTQIQQELAATARYRFASGTSLAERRAAALEQVLIHPKMSDENGTRVEFDIHEIAKKLEELYSFISTNKVDTATEGRATG